MAVNHRYVKAARPYALAASLAALALFIRWLATPWVGTYFRLTLLYGAVALAVRYGGIGPGLLVAVGGYLGSWWLIPGPQPQGLAYLANASGTREFLIYAICCSIIVILAEGLRRARRRAAEDTAALRASEERFRVAVESARLQLQTVTDVTPAGMARCSRDLRYVWINPQLAEWIGRPVDEIVGRPIKEVIGEESFRAFLPHYEAVLSGQRVEHEQKVAFARGGIQWVSAVYVPMFEADGAVNGWVAVITNITQSKHLELALLEADRRKDEFLAVLAHELRNPLAPMRNALEVLHLRTPPEPLLDHARGIIDRQLMHLSRLVDDLLDLSRVTQGRIQLQRARVAVSEMIAHAVEVSTPSIEAAGHVLEVSMPREALYVDGDMTRLAQIVGNLLNNAAKYTSPGGHIKLTATREQAEVRIDVEDTGIGIPAEMLPHIFDMFVQVNPSLDRSQGGLGIGLTLVSRLAAMHGGRVEARSAGAGKGSTFTVRLPAAEEAPSGQVRPVEPSAAAPHRRVLIVDDNVDSAESLSMLLGELGHETRLAHDGEQALATVRTFRPDVVLLDIGLPLVNGYEVARRIRRESRGEGPNLIAVTGWGQAEDRRLAKEAGFDHHVTKPVELSVLSRLLASERQRDSGARTAGVS